MTIRTRPATEADYQVAGAICVAAYLESGQIHDQRGYAEELADVAARARDAEVIVADDPDTGEILGNVTLVLAGQQLAEIALPGEAEFRMLAVEPSAQRRGVGSALVRACLDRASALGCTAMAIYTRDFNEAAIRMYEGFGFVRTPDLDWTPLAGLRLVAMRVDLPARAGQPSPGPAT
ncbi:MAG TPA: N-acetyltransferase [Micromonosporaceae bacterium]|jgi:ribosomal protein S18 acetylase RimI-like enzyme|nr:N-acetyltransferase [Micromonosporaceae bacterium]